MKEAFLLFPVSAQRTRPSQPAAVSFGEINRFTFYNSLSFRPRQPIDSNHGTTHLFAVIAKHRVRHVIFMAKKDGVLLGYGDLPP